MKKMLRYFYIFFFFFFFFDGNLLRCCSIMSYSAMASVIQNVLGHDLCSMYAVGTYYKGFIVGF